MVKIRLRRVGAKKQPTYRVVVADSRAPRDGRFLENIGHYNPRTDPPTVVIYEDRALYWLSKGAQPSDAVARFFEKLGMADKVSKVHAGAPIDEVAAPRPETPSGERARTAARRGRKAAPEPVEAEMPDATEAEATEAEAAAAEPGQAMEAEPEAVATEDIGAAEVAEETMEAEAPAEEPKPSAGARAMSLEELELSGRVANALTKAGISSAGELADKLAEGEEELIAVPGIGAKAAEEIREKLAEHGL